MDQRKTKLWPRCLALLLSVVMVVGMLPAAGAVTGNYDPNHNHTSACKKLICTKNEGDYECGKDGQYEGCPEKDKQQVAHQHNETCKKKVDADGNETNEYDCNIQYDEIEVDHVHGPSCTVHTHDASCAQHVHNNDCYEWSCPENPPVVPDAVTGVSLNQTSASVKVGETVNLTATVSVTGNAGTGVTWKSDDEKVATVSGGKVTAKAAGKTTITATSTADSTKSATCTVTVTATDGPKLSASSLSLRIGETGTIELTGVANGAAVTWKSDNSNVATVSGTGVSNGKSTCTVTAGNRSGKAVVTAAVDGKDYKCDVTVSGFSLSSTSPSVAVKKSVEVSIKESLPSGYTVEWDYTGKDITLSTKTGAKTKITGNNAGTKTGINVKIKNDKGTIVQTLGCDVTVTNAGAEDITYSTDGDTPVDFVAKDFNDVCNTKEVADRKLDYIYFTSLPSSSYGTLYYKYDAGTKKGTAVKASSGEKYYYEGGSKNDRLIEDLTFVPKSADDRTVTLNYTGCAINGTEFSGQVKITIGASGDLVYSISKNGTLELDADDFADFFKKESSSSTGLNYIIFDSLPSSSKGTLYFKYDEDKSESRNTAVTRKTEYYYKGSDAIDDITFVAAEGYTGTVEIPFTAYNGRSGSGSEVSGTLTIKVGKSSAAADITYSVERNGTLELNVRDFNDYCKEATNSKSNLDYVTFTLPSSNRGTLYSAYSSSSRNTALKSSTKCYRSAGKSDVDLDEVVFVPASGYTGTVSVSFTGYNLDGDKFTGTMKITVGKGGGDINYKADTGRSVTFDTSDFFSYCQDELGSKATLDYVTFDLPSSSKGTLYYDYSEDSRDNTEVKRSTKYYRKGRPYLDQVTFVPARNVTGEVSINFYGASTAGDEFEGTVVITYNTIKDPGVIRYTSNGGQVPFILRDFTNACDVRGGAGLDFVKLEIPDARYGKLYVDYISATRNGGLISPSMSYGTSGNNSLAQVSFVPKAGFSGVAQLYYTGTDKDGSTYRGTIEITVTPPAASANFNDVGANYNWAAPSVDYLYQAGIVTGTDSGGFSPASKITRGDFVLMLYRAFNLRASGSSTFTDVDPNAYYAQAVAAAQSLKIATGGGDGRFNPTAPLTRQDAMVLIQRTINATGSTLRDGADTALNGFADRDKVAAYAQGAVAALVQAGIIKGDDNGLLNPTGSLSRAEMATILHRVLTM